MNFELYPVGLLEAITDVIPLCFGRIIAKHHKQMERNTLHEGVPCLAPGGVMNIAP